jgi:WD40 repeat protein
LAILNIETGDVSPPIHMPHFKYTTIAIAPNSKLLYAGSKNGVVLEFNCTTGKFSNSVGDDLNQEIEHLLVTPNNKSLLVVDANSVMYQYRTDDRVLEINHGEIHRGRTRAISLTRDGMFLFSCCNLGGLRQFSFTQRKVLKTWSPFDRGDKTGLELPHEGFNCMTMAPGRLISSDSNGKILEISVLDSVYDQQSTEVLKIEGDESNLGKFSGLV